MGGAFRLKRVLWFITTECEHCRKIFTWGTSISPAAHTSRHGMDAGGLSLLKHVCFLPYYWNKK